MIDRRKFKRLQINITVIYRVREPLIARIVIGDNEIEASALNLSQGGIALVTSRNVPCETVLDIRFSLSKMDPKGLVSLYAPMKISGQVRSNLKLSEDEFRLGICFVEINAKDKAKIAEFVEQVKSA